MPRGIPNNRRVDAVETPVVENEPGKISRAIQERRARRKKRGATSLTGIKLAVEQDRLDPAFHHRWVRDTGDRVRQMENEDYEIVPGAAAADETAGTTGRKHGGTEDAGNPYGMVLMRKPREWHDEDQKDKQRPLDEMENAIRRGTAHQNNEPDLRGVSYTPNRIDS